MYQLAIVVKQKTLNCRALIFGHSLNSLANQHRTMYIYDISVWSTVYVPVAMNFKL